MGAAATAENWVIVIHNGVQQTFFQNGNKNSANGMHEELVNTNRTDRYATVAGNHVEWDMRLLTSGVILGLAADRC